MAYIYLYNYIPTLMVKKIKKITKIHLFVFFLYLLVKKTVLVYRHTFFVNFLF